MKEYRDLHDLNLSSKDYTYSYEFLLSCKTFHTKHIKEVSQGVPNVNFSFNGTSPLIEASRVGNIQTLELLLAKGADVNLVISKLDRRYTSALETACTHNQMRVIKFLLEHKADPNIPGICKEPPLVTASRAGRKKIVELLLQHGADVNQANGFGDTPLIVASKNGRIDIINRLLAEKNIQIDAVSNSGYTALIAACEWNLKKVVPLLLNAGADRTVKREGRTAAEYTVLPELRKLVENYQPEAKSLRKESRLHKLYSFFTPRSSSEANVSTKETKSNQFTKTFLPMA